MRTLIPRDTEQALGNLKPENRSLYFDRFADPALKEEDRQAWFASGCSRVVPKAASQRYRESFLPPATQFLYAQLKARLMINMAGGVMENAGLCLDRFGLPYIPGSAVKGCARRSALSALREWTQTNQKPDATHPLHPAIQGFDSPESLCRQITLTFGWVESDWTERSSDFVWAASGNFSLLEKVRASTERLRVPNRAGSIAFFPAYPDKDPGLELDILTCHHPDYYGNTDIAFAGDTEEPNPVTFPCVRAQTGDSHFVFALSALRDCPQESLRIAFEWLTVGLEVFGLGAKTVAGHGWFEARETHSRILARNKNRSLEQQRQAEEARKQAAEEQRRQEQSRLQQELAGLSESEKLDRTLAALGEQQFNQKILDFTRHSTAEKEALVRALRGPRADFWTLLKQRAEKKPRPLVQILDAIRSTSKSMNLGKMP
jgi:CRISPR-associated protein Cmr6